MGGFAGSLVSGLLGGGGGGGPEVKRVDPAVNDRVAGLRRMLNKRILGSEGQPSEFVTDLTGRSPDQFRFPGRFRGTPQQSRFAFNRGLAQASQAQAPQFRGFDTPSQAPFQRSALNQALAPDQQTQQALSGQSTEDLRQALTEQAQQDIAAQTGELAAQAAATGNIGSSKTGQAADRIAAQEMADVNRELAQLAFQDEAARRRSLVNRANQRDFIAMNVPQQADIIERRGIQREQQGFGNRRQAFQDQLQQADLLRQFGPTGVNVFTRPQNQATQAQAQMFRRNILFPTQALSQLQGLLGGPLNQAQVVGGGGGGGGGGINPQLAASLIGGSPFDFGAPETSGGISGGGGFGGENTFGDVTSFGEGVPGIL